MSDNPSITTNAKFSAPCVSLSALRQILPSLILSLGITASPVTWAESAEIKSEPANTPQAASTNEETANSQESAAASAASAPPQDTLGGSGLKERKLSVIFEQFVPSETISADNAVPFPTDI